MREPEQKSICGQLGYSWHANCAAQHPLHLVLSSVQVDGVGPAAGVLTDRRALTVKQGTGWPHACRPRLVARPPGVASRVREMFAGPAPVT